MVVQVDDWDADADGSTLEPPPTHRAHIALALAHVVITITPHVAIVGAPTHRWTRRAFSGKYHRFNENVRILSRVVAVVVAHRRRRLDGGLVFNLSVDMFASRSVVRAPARASVTSRRCRGSMHSVAVVRCAASREDDATASMARVGGVHANLARAVVVGALMMTTAGAGADAARADGDVELNVEALYAAATTTSAASEAAVRDTSSTYAVNWKDLLDAPEATASGSKKAKASKASAPVPAPAPAPAVVKAQEKKEQEMRQVNSAKSQREEYAAAQRAEKNAAKKARDEAVMAKVEARRAEQRAVLAERERQAAEDLAKFQAERAEQRARMEALAASKRSTSPAVTAPVPKTKKPAASTKSAAAKKSTAKASAATKKKTTTTVAKAAKKSAPVYTQRKSKPAKKRTNKGAIDRYSLRNTRKQRGGSPLALPGFIALAGFTYYLLLQEEED